MSIGRCRCTRLTSRNIITKAIAFPRNFSNIPLSSSSSVFTLFHLHPSDRTLLASLCLMPTSTLPITSHSPPTLRGEFRSFSLPFTSSPSERWRERNRRKVCYNAYNGVEQLLKAEVGSLGERAEAVSIPTLHKAYRTEQNSVF